MDGGRGSRLLSPIKKPFETLVIFTLIVGMWFVVAGVVRVVSAFASRETLGGTIGVGTLPPDPATVEAIDRRQREHAATVADAGAEFARSVGFAAEPQAVPDEVDVADILIGIARERGAAVVVVGSHGISGLRSRLLGSIPRKLIEHCDRPVLVIRDA